MDNSTNQEAFIKIIKTDDNTCEVQVEGHLDDLICMLSAAILAHENLGKLLNSAIQVTEMYKKYEENPTSFNIKNMPSC